VSHNLYLGLLAIFTVHCRLRIGTFNVNGKMPSQDLCAWVQGDGSGSTTVNAEKETPVLQPVKNISPLSLGEVVKNPFTWSKHVPM
jgi:phosphatidylinositol-bisphosphatase